MIKKVIIPAIAMIVLVTSIAIPLSINENNKTIDVVIMAGQSNAGYLPLGENSIEIINEEYPEIPTHNLYYYGNTSEPAQYGQIAQHYSMQPMYAENGWNIHGYGPVLCNELSKRSNHDVLYINIGSPGRTIQQLSPDGIEGKWGFSIIKEAISEANKNYNTVNILGFCWAQGEGDYFTSVNTYKQYFNDILLKFNSFECKEGYVIHTRNNYGGNSNIALEQIAIVDPNVRITCEFTETFNENNGYLLEGEPIHYSQSGRNLIAKELGNTIEIPDEKENYYSKLLPIIPIMLIISIIVFLVRDGFLNKY